MDNFGCTQVRPSRSSAEEESAVWTVVAQAFAEYVGFPSNSDAFEIAAMKIRTQLLHDLGHLDNLERSPLIKIMATEHQLQVSQANGS